jgi:hypothetical protein
MDKFLSWLNDEDGFVMNSGVGFVIAGLAVVVLILVILLLIGHPAAVK